MLSFRGFCHRCCVSPESTLLRNSNSILASSASWATAKCRGVLPVSGCESPRFAPPSIKVRNMSGCVVLEVAIVIAFQPPAPRWWIFAFLSTKSFTIFVKEAKSKTIASRDNYGNTPIHNAMDFNNCRLQIKQYSNIVQYLVLTGDKLLKKKLQISIST